MEYNLYKEMEKQRGEYAEYGNVELSYNYLMRVISHRKYGNDAKFLDVGTNIGTLPFMMYSREKLKMFGAETRSEAVEKGKKKYHEIADMLFVVDETLKSIPNDTFDVVTMFDVIEHIPHVDEYLENEIYRVLKPDGIFVFQTPNARINPLFEIVRTKSLLAYKSYHCSLQTPKTLEKILKKAGFDNIIIEKNTIDSEFNRKKLKKYFGPLGVFALKVFKLVPIGIYPNLWGYCEKSR